VDRADRRYQLTAEIIALTLGVALRVALFHYDYAFGYDFDAHMKYVHWVADNHSLPPIEAFYVAYHPPLYYALAAVLVTFGLASRGLLVVSILLGIIKLGIVWYGARRLLPEGPARPVAMLAAAVVPAGVYLDGMVSNEALLTLLCAAAIVMIPRFVDEPTLKRGMALSVLLGLAMDTKVSALMIIVALALGGGLVALRRGRAAALPIAAAVALALAIALPVHARHYGSVHKLFPTTFDTTGWERKIVAQAEWKPYLERRSLAYVLSPGSGAIFDKPWWPSDSEPDSPRSYFWPQLVATAFSDYFLVRFDGVPRAGEPTLRLAWQRPLRASTVPWMRGSVLGGALLSATVMCAFFACGVAAWRARKIGMLVLLASLALAVAGQLHFAWKFPFDKQGMVKAHYLQFLAPVLCGLLGVAIDWLWKRRWGRPIAALNLLALAAVAAYTVRTRL
jgi:hypothetical protein